MGEYRREPRADPRGIRGAGRRQAQAIWAFRVATASPSWRPAAHRARHMTHIETPLDPIKMSAIQLEGKAQVDKVIAFLKAEYPDCSRIRESAPSASGHPPDAAGIVGSHQLTPTRFGTAPSSRRDRALHLADELIAASRVYLGAVRPRPYALRAAIEHHRRRRRQFHGRRGAAWMATRRRYRGARHGTVHGNGQGGGQTRSTSPARQDASDRHRRAQGSAPGQLVRRD